MASTNSRPTLRSVSWALVAEGEPERQHREGQEGRDHHDHRGDDVEDLVGAGRPHVLLEEQLDAVGQGLEDPEGPDPVGADPGLHEGDHPPLQPDGEQHRQHQSGEHPDDLDDQDEQVPDSPGHAAASSTALTLTRRAGAGPSSARSARSGWLAGTKAQPGATVGATRTGSRAVRSSPKSTSAVAPSARPSWAASSGCSSARRQGLVQVGRPGQHRGRVVSSG
jgi:hypothetical protein